MGGISNLLHNYMNYTGDDCVNEFTPGQSERMDQMVGTYRSSLGSNTDIIFNDNHQLADDLEILFFDDVTIASGVTLEIGNNTIIDMQNYKLMIEGSLVVADNVTFKNVTEFMVSSTGNVHFQGNAVVEFMAEPVFPPFIYTSPDFYSAGKTTASNNGTLTMRAASASPSGWSGELII